MLNARRPRQRPADYEARLRDTLRALKEVKLTEDGRVGTVDQIQLELGPDDPSQVRFRHFHPSLAALQLFVLDETGFGVRYVRDPVKNGVKMVESLHRAAIVAGDIAAHDDIHAMARRTSKFERGYPLLYAVLRHVILLQMAALHPTPLSIAEENRVYERMHTGDTERLLKRLERALQEWHGKLVSGAEEWNSAQRDTEIQRIMTTIVDDLMRIWRNALPPPSVVSVKMERLDDAFYHG